MANVGFWAICSQIDNDIDGLRGRSVSPSFSCVFRGGVARKGNGAQSRAVSGFGQAWVLARLGASAVAALLLLYALRVAWRLLRGWQVTRSAEGQLAMERRAELVAAVVQGALGLTVVALAITMLGADRQSGSIRGAMCAYGVFGSTDAGFWSLGLSVLTAIACGLWSIVHRLDLTLEQPTLTRLKFIALFAIAPLVLFDLGLFARFVSQLDLEAHASCCSLSLGADAVARWGAGGTSSGLIWFCAALTTGLVSAACFWALRRQPTRRTAWVGGLLSTASAVLMAPAVLFFVAPHAYETPAHRCPFCLLHGAIAPFGWSLFATLLIATTAGLGAAVVASLQSRAGDPVRVRALQHRLGGIAAVAWALVCALCAAPVLRYLVLTGTTL